MFVCGRSVEARAAGESNGHKIGFAILLRRKSLIPNNRIGFAFSFCSRIDSRYSSLGPKAPGRFWKVSPFPYQSYDKPANPSCRAAEALNGRELGARIFCRRVTRHGTPSGTNHGPNENGKSHVACSRGRAASLSLTNSCSRVVRLAHRTWVGNRVII